MACAEINIVIAAQAIVHAVQVTATIAGLHGAGVSYGSIACPGRPQREIPAPFVLVSIPCSLQRRIALLSSTGCLRTRGKARRRSQSAPDPPLGLLVTADGGDPRSGRRGQRSDRTGRSWSSSQPTARHPVATTVYRITAAQPQSSPSVPQSSQHCSGIIFVP